MSVLSEPVLVLNNNWNPIGTYTVRKAFKKIFAEQARIVDPADCTLYDFESWVKLPVIEGHSVIQTYNSGFRTPEVIVLNSDAKFGRRDKLAYSRRNIMKRDGHICQYCGKQTSVEKLTIDHVTPKSRGGQSSWLNCVVACLPCNFKKADRTPDEAGLKLKNRPYEPKWTPVFKVSTGKFKQSWSQFIGVKAMA